MPKFPQKDASGKRLRRGDIVRIIGIPDGLDRHPESKRYSLPVFRYLVGKYKRIADFDELGHAEISFTIRKGRHKGMHTVWIEPYLLKIPAQRRHR